MSDLIKTKQNLLKLIKEAEEQFSGTGKALLDIEDYVAEYLTANGVIVPPCKVGDTVYYIEGAYYNSNRKTVRPIKVTEISWKCDRSGRDLGFALIAHSTRYKFSSIGKTVFLTREEAEAKLKGGEQG
jgi:hypothetical protein